MVKSIAFSLICLGMFPGMLVSQSIRILDESLMSNNFILRKNETIKDKISGNIFVRLELNKKRCFIGEPIVATFKLYTRLKSESKIVKRPSFNGFSVYDMISPDVSESGTELFKGKLFNVYVLRKVQLYALQSGSFTIEPMEVENEVNFMKLMNADQHLSVDDLLGRYGALSLGDYSMIKETVHTASVSQIIVVDPLPAPIPADYNGYTGSFKMNVKMSKDSIYVNDLVHLKILISGKGNFPVMNPPIIEWGSDLDVFEPEIVERFDLSVSPITGAKIYTFPFVPKKAGNIKLPIISIRYFDPQRKSFILESVALQYVTILPAKAEMHQTSAGNSENYVAKKFIVILIMFLLTVFLTYYFYVGGRQNKSVENPDFQKKIGPILFIEDRIELDQLEKLMARGDTKSFYKCAVEAIDHHMMLKFGMGWPVDKKILFQLNIQQKDHLLALAMMKERFEGYIYSPMLTEPDIRDDFNTILSLLHA